MFGIELKWFILFAVIIVVGGGIEHRLKQIKNELEKGFFEFKQVIKTPLSNEPIGATLLNIREHIEMGTDEIDSIHGMLDEIRTEIQNMPDIGKEINSTQGILMDIRNALKMEGR
jgi:hypothetical protein